MTRSSKTPHPDSGAGSVSDRIRPNIECRERLLRIARETCDRRGEVQTLNGIGLDYLMIGECVRAVEFLQQAIGIAREIGDVHSQGQSLWGMCMATMSACPDDIELHARTIDLARVALRIFEQFGDPTADLVRAALVKWTAQAGKDKKKQ